jgi:hypothetical protein
MCRVQIFKPDDIWRVTELPQVILRQSPVSACRRVSPRLAVEEVCRPGKLFGALAVWRFSNDAWSAVKLQFGQNLNPVESYLFELGSRKACFCILKLRRDACSLQGRCV